jgi:hypothetical protein
MIRQKTREAKRLLSRSDEDRELPTLRFSPTAWAKLLYLRDLGDSEVGGFGITAADDLLYVENVQLVRQLCTGASVAFDDQAVADFFDTQVDCGRRPEQFARAWMHTHPGNFPEPSVTDEETFTRVFGRMDWAVTFILAGGGQSYARLRFHVGPGGDVDLPVRVDYTRPFAASDHAAWEEEYLACVETTDLFFLPERHPRQPAGAVSVLDPWEDEDWFLHWDRPTREEEPGFIEGKEVRHAV